MSARSKTAVEGRLAAGFEAVADAFAATLAPGSGAAFAAFVDGEPVVDVWGGVANPYDGEPWREDTVQLIFSGTKGLVAVCLLRLLERGALELDAPVARYWPEFVAREVLVRHVVSHTAGLPGLRRGFAAGELLDNAALARAVAADEPLWPPGSRLAYHALSFGWLCDGLVRRVDGRSVGQFFADEVAAPLELELWIGLPPDEEARVAQLVRGEGYAITVGDEPDPLLGVLYGDLLDGTFPWNDPRFHHAEIPAANAIGTVRSIARLYGYLARGGDPVVSAEALRVGRQELSRGLCAVTKRPYAFGVGFELQTALGSFGSPMNAFGHTGSGGSVHGAWPDEGVGFSYAPTELRSESDDVRAGRILAALHEAAS